MWLSSSKFIEGSFFGCGQMAIAFWNLFLGEGDGAEGGGVAFDGFLWVVWVEEVGE